MTKHASGLSRAELVQRISGAVERCCEGGPVALFLSGGLDSAIIQAVAKLDRLYVVSWPDCDNRMAAEFAAMGRPLTTVSFTRAEMLEVLPDVAETTRGTGTWSQVCQWFLARRAAEDGAKVVLTGECADELFGGYARYRIFYWLERMMQDPHLTAYRPIIEHMVGTRGDLLTRMLTRHMPYEQANSLTGGETDINMVATARNIDAGQPLQDLLANETAVIESHGVEARYPFNDPELQKWVRARLTAEDMINECECKHALRDAARRLGVHKDITEERTKKGLFIPQSWRPDGEQMWSRRWFDKLMHDAYTAGPMV